MPSANVLRRLAECLRADPVIGPHVSEPATEPQFGRLVAAGPRAAEAPEEYALLVEAIREGYLLHYERSRLLDRSDEDLALLAGDYLYALGLERLAARGDLEAVAELADLISLSARLHARADGPLERAADGLWLASCVAVAAGAEADHERGKALLRAGQTGAGVAALVGSARQRAADSGLSGALAETAQQVGFALPERG